MAKQLDSISEKLQAFISKQNIFFVATARSNGRINLSPKGMDSFRIINENIVVWLNLTGSGNETAIHLLENDRMTIMFCSFEKNPMILRLYGNAIAHHPGDKEYENYLDLFPSIPGTRQIFEMKVEMVQTSCGYAVPFMDFLADRTTLVQSSERKGVEGIEQYWKDKNKVSIDGFETKAFD